MNFFYDKTTGFKSSRIILMIILVALSGGGLLIYALFSSPFGDNQDGGVFNGSRESEPIHKPNNYGGSNEITAILNNSSKADSSSPSGATEESQVKQDVALKDVPSISGEQVRNSEDTPKDEIAKQIQQLENQHKIERVNDSYSAYSGKINVFGGSGGDKKNNASDVETTDSAVDNKSTNPTKLSPDNKLSDPNSVYSSARLQKPLSPYELKGGSVINCALQTRIVSQLDGQVSCLVSDNIYDSVSGRYLLIPQGAKLLGGYKSGVLIGNDRLAVAFTRIIYPNGNSITLTNLPGSDTTGANGLSDEVDNHYWQLFGSSFILGVIRYAGNQASSAGDLTSATGQSVTNTSQQQVQQINVAPTITIREGFQIAIIIDKDLILEPYKE